MSRASGRARRVPTAFLFLLACGATLAQASVPYDIVYVRQPRFGDTTNTTWPEVFHPGRLDPGADLVLLHPDRQGPLAVGERAVTAGVGLRHREHPIEGVQFHPESILTDAGHKLLSNFLELQA